MKTKKISIFAKIFSIIMIICFAFLCVGCMGREPGDYGDDGEDSGFMGDLAFDMYGAKVLYRPDEYNYDTGSGASEGETNDYYGSYAWNILRALQNTYGLTNSLYTTKYISEDMTSDNENFYFLHDSIRYKVDTFGNVNKLKTIDASGNESETDISSGEQYVIIGADINQTWNWTFDYDLSDTNLTPSMNAVLLDASSFIESSKIYSSTYVTKDQFTSTTSSKYQIDGFKTNYSSIYLGTSTPDENENYSDYVKALEYAIYSYALDLTPGEVDVAINDNVTETNPQFYTLTITETINGQPVEKTVDNALEDIISKFKKLGSYVGLIDRQIDNIGEWVKTNVIGSKILDDNFYSYDSVTEVQTTDEHGNVTISYEFSSAPVITQLGRNYDSAVDKIIEAVCQDVSIGQVGDKKVTIKDRFLASQVKEYAGDTFIIAGDANFPKYEEGQHPVAIQPLEYQSVALMLKEDTKIEEIWLALKYDAALDGTTEGVWGEKYLDIIVEINYFSKEKQKLYTLGSQQTRVYDGPYEFSGDYPEGFPEEHGTLFFDNFHKNCKDEELKSLLNKGVLTVSAFDIQNNDLKTDVGLSGYNGNPLVSKNPLTLVGTTNLRNYYSIIEPTDDELSDPNKTYITGRFNEDMFKGTEEIIGCDYLEITYKVLKTKGDTEGNYKFYTGIAGIF